MTSFNSEQVPLGKVLPFQGRSVKLMQYFITFYEGVPFVL